MLRIFILCLVAFTTSAQVELWVGPTVNTNNWTVISPEVDGKYAIHRPWSEVGSRWGAELTLWYKEYFGIRTGVQGYCFIGGYEFNAPIVGIMEVVMLWFSVKCTLCIYWLGILH
jgi:hypothetical protein